MSDGHQVEQLVAEQRPGPQQATDGEGDGGEIEAKLVLIAGSGNDATGKWEDSTDQNVA